MVAGKDGLAGQWASLEENPLADGIKKRKGAGLEKAGIGRHIQQAHTAGRWDERKLYGLSKRHLELGVGEMTGFRILKRKEAGGQP